MKLFIIIILLLSGANTYSCSCGDKKPTAEEYFEQCEQIFVARLVDGKYMEAQSSENESPFPIVKGSLSEPSEIFKGKFLVGQHLETGMAGTSCESTPVVGEEYLVCGNGESSISVAQCDLTLPLNWNSGGDILELLRYHKVNLGK